ncbi:hypothetical protein [Actinopolymorpha sp. B11F2]|uniref:hypothetical protein n=1 Tax=Actinopolymorpha sp. B11F2 TaxID=3160862 RepID=UPI0032E3E48E
MEHHDRRAEQDEYADRQAGETQPLVAVREPRRSAQDQVVCEVARDEPHQLRRPVAGEQTGRAGGQPEGVR